MYQKYGSSDGRAGVVTQKTLYFTLPISFRTRDKNQEEISPKPPMVAFEQPANLKKTLVHAKLPYTRPARHMPVLSSCGKCTVCPFIEASKTFKSTHTGTKYNITGMFSCNTIGVLF